jgi:ribokinase
VPAVTAPFCVIGDFAWDVLIRTNSQLLHGGDTFGEVMLTPGGSAANVAVWASRAGMATEFIGKIGRDRLGQLAEEDLAGEHITTHLVETSEHLTGCVAVFVDQTGERSMVSGRGADFYLLASEVPKETVRGSSHLHMTAWSFFVDPPRSAARSAAHLARDSGATLSFDPGSFQMIEEMGVSNFLACTQDLGIDVFLPNYQEGEVLTGLDEPEAIAAALAKLYPQALIMLKLDADGALVYDNGVATRLPPATNNVVDATGAGDSFAGAFLARFLGGETAVDAAHFATKISAWVIEHLGARPEPDAQLRAILP